MKKVLQTFTIIMLMLLTGGGNILADEVTVTFTAETDKSSTTTLSKDGVTITTTAGTFDNGENYRFFSKSTAKVSVTTGTLTKVEFTCTGSGKKNYGPGLWGSPSPGSYTYSGNVGTWKGEAQTFTLTAEDGQVRATQIQRQYNVKYHATFKLIRKYV